MQQVPLYEEQPYLELISIAFGGNNPLLLEHKIDASIYAQSLIGYSELTKFLFKVGLGVEVEVSILSHDEGSFKSVLQVVTRIIELGFATAGFLAWLGVTPQDVSQYASSTTACIVEKVKEYKGHLDLLIDDIMQSDMSDEEKDKLVKALKDKVFGESLDKFTSPLDYEGYQTITIFSSSKQVAQISLPERKYFKYEPPAQEEIEKISEVVEIIYLSPELSKWQFKGANLFWGDVLDKKSLDKIKHKKSSELTGCKFFVLGRKISTRKRGAKIKKVRWEIDSIEQLPEQGKLL